MNEPVKTPYFIIDESLLENNIRDFREALSRIWPNSLIAYSVKTNSLPWILSWMNEHGVLAEVVSDDEYQLALLSGYSTDKIVFNGPIKSENYLKTAFEGGSIINIDSKHELDFITNERPEIKGVIGVRVNVDPSIFDTDDVGYQEDGFRFGFSRENGELQKVFHKLKRTYGDVSIGLHMHVNSITRSLRVYQAIARYVARIVSENNIFPAYIDIGGGFFGGVPGKTTPEEYINGIKNEFEGIIDMSMTKLIIEPGSAIIGSAIDLHTSVIDIKDTMHGRIVTTDGSRIYIDPLWQKKQYFYTTDSINQVHKRQIVCGYTCMDHDRMMVIENQPELMIGNHIIYHRVGNYTVTFGGPFIRPFPPVYVQRKGHIELVRKKMTVEEYYRMETV